MNYETSCKCDRRTHGRPRECDWCTALDKYFGPTERMRIIGARQAWVDEREIEAAFASAPGYFHRHATEVFYLDYIVAERPPFEESSTNQSNLKGVS